MTTTRRLITAIIALATAGQVSAAPTRVAVRHDLSTIVCPPVGAGGRLKNVALIDGTVEENAQLKPDGERRRKAGTTSWWEVVYVYDAGRQVHASCVYPQGPAIDVAVTSRVERCELSETRILQLTCR